MNRWHVFFAIATLLPAFSVAQKVQAPSQSTSAASQAPHSDNKPSPGLPNSAGPEVIAERIAAAQEAQIPHEEPDRAKEKREKADLVAQEEMAYWAKWVFWATGAGALASVFAAWLLFQTFRLSRVSSEIQLRAYVSAHFDSIPRFAADQTIAIKYILRNYGQTPASKFRCQIKTEVWPFPLPKNWEIGQFDAVIPAAFSLAPGTDRIISYTSKTAIDRDTINKIFDERNIRVYVVGSIHYEDVFGKVRQTRFCTSSNPNLRLKQVSDGEEVKEGIVFNDADQWNDAT